MLIKSENRSTAACTLLRSAVLFILILGAVIWLWTSLIAIASFALRYPAWDQYRSYVIYLTHSFPSDALQAENGHRTIIPNLVRLAEIQWLAASQVAQVLVGCASALLALTLIIVTIVRERNVAAVARAAACLLAVIAFFWLGNARILIHGTEMLNVYFVMLFCVVAILAVSKSRGPRPVLWMCVAGIFCMAATFSIGAGMASFPTVLLLGLVLRISWRYLSIPVALLAITLWIYLAALPGGDGVRSVLVLDPAANATVFLRWLSAPWVTASLGYVPSIESWAHASTLMAKAGLIVIAILSWIASPFGNDWMMREGLMIGIVGILAYIVIFIHASRQHASLSNTRLLGLGLATFVLGVAGIICLARLDYFTANPDQIFADRYLPWSCLFWLGLGLYATATAADSIRRHWHTPAIALGVGLVWLVFSQSNSHGWMAIVHRHNQQSAIAAQLGIWDPERFSDSDASHEDILTTLALFKQGHLSMFAEPGFGLVEHGWHAPAQLPATLAGSSAHIVRQFDDTLGQRHVADFEGWMPNVPSLSRDTVLVVVDARGDMRGLAKFSFLGANDKWFKYRVVRKRGFDGYALAPRAGEQFRVLALDATSTQVIAVATLEIPEPVAPSSPSE